MGDAISGPLAMFATFVFVVAVIGLIRGHLNWARIGSRKAAGIACGIGVALFLLAGAIQSEPEASVSNEAATSAAATGDTNTTAAATTTVAPSTSATPPPTTTNTITATTNPPTPTPESTTTEQAATPNSNADQAFLDAIHDLGISGHSDHQLANWGATSCVYMSVNGASAIETARELANTFPLTQRQGYLVVYEAIKYMCPDQKSKLPN